MPGSLAMASMMVAHDSAYTDRCFPEIPGRNVSWRAVILMAFLGCAGPRYRTPCTVRMDVTLEDRHGSDKACRDLGVDRWDDGRLIHDTEIVAGCALYDNLPRIIVRDDPFVAHHELRHQWDRHCR